jgi:2-methylisocitrate lyase-like PEP mutase family enzyme
MTLRGVAGQFLELHVPGAPLVQPNAWDAGSARVLEWLGFQAIATTSSGFAATLGRLDGDATREEVLHHCEALAAAVSIPVAADTENGFADDPDGVADTVRLAADTGLAGCSIEDWSGTEIYDFGLAVERVQAAVETARALPFPFTLTARAENLLHGNPDLDDTIARLQAYERAGADVLFAPGLRSAEQVRAVCGAVSKPVNVLVHPKLAPQEAAAAGAQRMSVGGALTWVAVAAFRDAAEALKQGDLSPLATRVPLKDWLG